MPITPIKLNGNLLLRDIDVQFPTLKDISIFLAIKPKGLYIIPEFFLWPRFIVINGMEDGANFTFAIYSIVVIGITNLKLLLLAFGTAIRMRTFADH